jgi:phosphoribosylformylglycinamidine synthase
MNSLGNSTPTVSDSRYFILVFNTIQQLINNGHILAGHDISAGGMVVTLLEMTFSCIQTGLEIDLSALPEPDLLKILMSENPGLIIQVDSFSDAINILKKKQIRFHELGKPVPSDRICIRKGSLRMDLEISKYRDIWFKTSCLLDQKQCGEKLAKERFQHYKNQSLWFRFKDKFDGKAKSLGIDLLRISPSGIKAAIIREKGVNGDREMAYIMHLAGFDVRDVHMTDLINGRETLDDIHFIVFVGGFSNSDVLGSAKGWAGAFLYNDLARKALDQFYRRTDTLSLGVCNGCQLMVELELIKTRKAGKPVMLINESMKFESSFLNVEIPESNSIMFKTLVGARLGIWVAHGEGRFSLPGDKNDYNVALHYGYSAYPGNPNGSDHDVAGLCSDDGRHLAVMPHLERAIFPWNWAMYPENRKNDEISPWVEAFVNAREWIKENSIWKPAQVS